MCSHETKTKPSTLKPWWERRPRPVHETRPRTWLSVFSFNYCCSLSQRILGLNKTAEKLLFGESISYSGEKPPKAKALVSCKAWGFEAYFIVWEWFHTDMQALWRERKSIFPWAGWNCSNLMLSRIHQIWHPVLHITFSPRWLGSLTKGIWVSKTAKVKTALFQQPDFVPFSQPGCPAHFGEV